MRGLRGAKGSKRTKRGGEPFLGGMKSLAALPLAYRAFGR